VNKIPIEDRAALQGQTCTNGVIEESETDEPPYIALGYEIEKTGGASELVWLYKGSMAPIEEDTSQKDGSIKYDTQKSRIIFIPRINDGKLRKFADSEGTGFVETTKTNWFSSVPAPSGT
jgi:phi13 family phage major tail protein